ncbi:MAG: TRAP transporter large permease [Verrucomicrobiia bacterium]|jgi:C4-dicarboxylate transporter DctM subunit|nr:TRAP transporter large permease [Opitutaceae bacterium]|tara:strand:+ start:1792 stop:3111 length:1320 start_codon:yes stop_codon:yes gene_type:complete
MTEIEVGLISVGLILVLIYSGLYIPVALGLVSFLGVWLLRGDIEVPIYLLSLAAADTIAEPTFAVVPLFALMGLLISEAGVGRDIYDVSNFIFRRLKGGLGIATVVANAIFASITGSSIASASVFTKVSIPEMKRFGYNPRFTVGVVAGSSVLGMLIPPSVMLILYAIITEQSVGHMFIAGVIPGILLSVAFGVAILTMATFFPKLVMDETAEPIEVVDKPSLNGLQILRMVLPILLLVGIVLGGIYTGWFTATEAGAAGAMGALIVAIFKKRLNLKGLWKVLIETGHITASILLLLIAASMYSRMLGIAGLPTIFSEWIQTQALGFAAIMVIYVVILILMGTILDTVSIILIVVPLFLPILEPMGIHLVWFGIVTVIGAEIGLLTPPLGVSCFVIHSSLNDPDISLSDIFKGAFPFALIMLAVLILIILFPSLSLVFI